jgi:uncharacterized membrane protein YphA (DoxX/SURF4 family)
MLAVLALIALRLALGCHFLYEGVWKIKHRDEFSAEPFLTQAKGPIAPLFYWMIPDIDGRQQLTIVTDASGKKAIDSAPILARWNDIRVAFVDYYSPEGASDDAKAAHQRLNHDTDQVLGKFRQRLDRYLASNVDDIVDYLGAIDRFQSDKERNQTAPFQKQRRWERMMDLRHEVDKWVANLEAQEKALKNSFYDQLTPEEKQKGLMPASWNPFRWSRIEQINFAVTYSLTAIGICLMIGLCTPLAALGGAAFMCFVVMTQPAFPGIFPADPPVVGHALLINKDFVEMVALLVISATAAGRWGGLDFFLWRWIVDPICSRWKKKCPCGCSHDSKGT